MYICHGFSRTCSPAWASGFTHMTHQHHLVAKAQIAGIVLKGKSLLVRFPELWSVLGSGPEPEKGTRPDTYIIYV